MVRNVAMRLNIQPNVENVNSSVFVIKTYFLTKYLDICQTHVKLSLNLQLPLSYH